MRHANPALEKTFKMHERGMDLEKAWRKNGEPTSWGNVTKQWKARCAAVEPGLDVLARAAAASSSSRPASRKRAAAVEPTPAKAPRREAPPSTGKRPAPPSRHHISNTSGTNCKKRTITRPPL